MQQPFYIFRKFMLLHGQILIICPYLRLTAETKIAVPNGTSLGFKPPA